MFMWLLKRAVRKEAVRNLARADVALKDIDASINNLQVQIQLERSDKTKEVLFKISDRLYFAKERLQKTRDEYEQFIEGLSIFFNMEQYLKDAVEQLTSSK